MTKFKCSPQWNIAILSPLPAVQNLSKRGTEILQFCREFSKCGKSAYVFPYKILQFCHRFQECNFLPKCWPKPSKYLKCMYLLMQVCNFATVFSIAVSAKYYSKSSQERCMCSPHESPARLISEDLSVVLLALTIGRLILFFSWLEGSDLAK